MEENKKKRSNICEIDWMYHEVGFHEQYINYLISRIKKLEKEIGLTYFVELEENNRRAEIIKLIAKCPYI